MYFGNELKYNMNQNEQNKRLYWVAKGFISFFIFFSAYFSYTHAEDLRKLGFPDYFRIELVIAKIIGAIVLSVYTCKGKRMGVCRIYYFNGFSIDSPYL
jgi:hypothetical protein